MTEHQIKLLLEKGAELEQFLFILYYTNPLRDQVKIIADDGTIKMTLNREKFIFLFNELLQPRTIEMEKNFQRIKNSLNTFGKWYFYDRTQNIFKEMGELPQKETLKLKEIPKTWEESVVSTYENLLQSIRYNDKQSLRLGSAPSGTSFSSFGRLGNRF